MSTDAIGMGLNLPVRRIVFLEVEKFDGVSRRPLVISEIKQIAGRAGRFGLYDTGYVTALGQKNLNYLKNTLNIPEQDIDIVSLGFPQVLLTMDAPLDAIIKLWHEAEPSAPFRKSMSMRHCFCMDMRIRSDTLSQILMTNICFIR